MQPRCADAQSIGQWNRDSRRTDQVFRNVAITVLKMIQRCTFGCLMQITMAQRGFCGLPPKFNEPLLRQQSEPRRTRNKDRVPITTTKYATFSLASW